MLDVATAAGSVLAAFGLAGAAGLNAWIPLLAAGLLDRAGQLQLAEPYDAIATTPTSAYSMAQAGRHALAKNLAVELAPTNIRVNTVALAFVETPAYERFMTPEEAQAVLDAVDGFHPLGRRGQPGDVVGAVGNTGRSTGAHLHYEVRVGNVPVDPMVYVQRARLESTKLAAR